MSSRWLTLSVVFLAYLIGEASFAESSPKTAAGSTQTGDSHDRTQAVGVLTSYNGDVIVNGKVVTGGTPLMMRDTIETRPHSRCTILLGRDAIIQLGADSRMELTAIEIEKRRTLLSLVHGTTRALVKTDRTNSGQPRREFKVRSRAATMGVRGTQIYIDSPKDLSLPQRFSTFEGSAVLELPLVVDVVDARGASARLQEVPITEGQGVETLAATLGGPRGDRPMSSASGSEPQRTPPQPIQVERYHPDQMKKWIDKSGGEIVIPVSEQAARQRGNPAGPPPPASSGSGSAANPPPGGDPRGGGSAGMVTPGMQPGRRPPVFDPVADSPTGSLRSGRHIDVRISVKKQ